MGICSFAILFAVALGCSGPGAVGSIRFAKARPVWRVDDQAPLAAAPRTTHYYPALYQLDSAFARRAPRAMELRADKPVLDINSLDEVPDSTWFVNRIGARDLTVEELKRGPNLESSPFDHRPWTIIGTKLGGNALGFRFEDALHRKFLLKFDAKELPELETGAHIIAHRLLWALGYNVPQDHVGYIRRSDLVIGGKAAKQGLDDAKLDEALKSVYVREDGQVRVLASLFIPGTPIGPWPQEGVRKDDPNDVIPHEQRRSLRGQYPIFAWLDHTDMKDDNSLDTFDHGHVTHYLLDFGKALGVMGTSEPDEANGHRRRWDLPAAMVDLLSLGLHTHPWEGIRQPQLRGVGLYDVEHFDPAGWFPVFSYWPLLDKDRFDAFWGAKLMMRFKPHELAAIVDEAQLSDPRAAKYLVDTLMYRQRITARYWFDRVAPLDAFTIDASSPQPTLCFTDLTLFYLLRDSTTTYAIDTFDQAGNATGFAASAPAGAKGRTCSAIPLAPGPDDYTIVRLRVRRDQHEMPPVIVHVARVAGQKLEVIGLRRR